MIDQDDVPQDLQCWSEHGCCLKVVLLEWALEVSFCYGREINTSESLNKTTVVLVTFASSHASGLYI